MYFHSQVADVLINPSPAEGGPLVLLEAWSAKKPMFMRPTGWATEYPDAVFTIKEGDSPSAIAQVVQDVAQAMEQGEGYPAAVVKRGKKIFQDRFSLEVVAKKWAATLLETLNKVCLPLTLGAFIFECTPRCAQGVVFGKKKNAKSGNFQPHALRKNEICKQNGCQPF